MSLLRLLPRSVPRTASRVLPRALPALRSISSTPAPLDAADSPSNASTDPDMVHRYPKPGDWDKDDLGHSMDGPGVDVGRHKRRTLASFSMDGKVCASRWGIRRDGENAGIVLERAQADARAVVPAVGPPGALGDVLELAALSVVF